MRDWKKDWDRLYWLKRQFDAIPKTRENKRIMASRQRDITLRDRWVKTKVTLPKLKFMDKEVPED